MAEFRIATATSTALLLSTIAIAPDASVAEGSTPSLPASASEVVLLANDGILPLPTDHLAVITAVAPALLPLGQTAADATTDSPQSLADLLGADSVTNLGPTVPAGHSGGSAIPTEYVGEDGAGFTTEYFETTELTDPALELSAQPSSVVRLPTGAAAARLTGEVAIPTDGTYEFTVSATGAARMLVGGDEVASLKEPTEGSATADETQAVASSVPTTSVTLELTAGTVLPVQVEMVDDTSPEPVLALGWRPPADVVPAAVASALEAAATAEAVLVYIPSLPARDADAAMMAGALPISLAELLPLVAASNPRIVVVTDAEADDDLADWTAPGILHAPTGSVDLELLAQLVTGETQPGGTLAVGLPLPHGPPPTAKADPQTDAAPAPLYPKGHGLIYWKYTPTSLAVNHQEATVEICSSGTASGATNVYVAASTAGSDELHPVGQTSIELAAGETASVAVPLDLAEAALNSPDAWPLTLHAGTSPDTMTITAELAASDTPRSSPNTQHKQQKQGGIVRPAVPGLTLTTGAGTVKLENAVERGGLLLLTGTLPTVSVSDARQGPGTGWTVSARATDLSGAAGPLPASNLGWIPTVLKAGDGVTAGPPVASAFSGGPGLGEPAVLGHASGPSGTVQFGADFLLEAPAATAPGTYSGTLTVTLFPSE